jgi:nicotinamide mononucleotide (NMN) deamidase PncC
MGTLRDRLSMLLGDPKDSLLLGFVCFSDVTLVKWLEVKNKSCHGFRAVSKTEKHLLIIHALKVDEHNC